jgi:DNA-binding GntR family transcriptional regulator
MLTDEHAAILDSIAAGDAENASKLVIKHIRGFYQSVGFSDMKWAG